MCLLIISCGCTNILQQRNIDNVNCFIGITIIYNVVFEIEAFEVVWGNAL